MTKKERVIAAIAGERADAVPSCFSLHFPEGQKRGKTAVEAHLNFFQETDTDILKIMNENLVPYSGVVRTPKDYCQSIQVMGMSHGFMQSQIAMTEEILSRSDKSAFTLGTLHGICASGIHPLEQGGMAYDAARQMQVDFLRWDPERMLAAMGRIADAMCELARAYVGAGVDGVYYAALGGEERFFSDEEFELWIKPFDLRIMREVKEAGGYLFLHICKDGLDMSRYAGYADCADVVNWGVLEAPLSLADGRKLFPQNTVMGGLANRGGPLEYGTGDEIEETVAKAVSEAGRNKFILGADCTLATDQDLRRVRRAVEAARRL